MEYEHYKRLNHCIRITGDLVKKLSNSSFTLLTLKGRNYKLMAAIKIMNDRKFSLRKTAMAIHTGLAPAMTDTLIVCQVQSDIFKGDHYKRLEAYRR